VSEFPPDSAGGPVFKNAVLYSTYIFHLVNQYELTAQPIPNMWFTKAAMAILEHKDSGQKLGVVSLHLKGFNPYETNEEKLHTSRRHGFDQLMVHIAEVEQLATQHGCRPVIVAGDFNEEHRPDWLPNRTGLMESKGYHHDGGLEPTEPISGWGKLSSDLSVQKSPSKIDWIFAKGVALKPADVAIPFRNASDHLPAFSQFQL
jgi:endonuclease/exonuclease/phosphatase family metal-dependent hydrolase